MEEPGPQPQYNPSVIAYYVVLPVYCELWTAPGNGFPTKDDPPTGSHPRMSSPKESVLCGYSLTFL